MVSSHLLRLNFLQLVFILAIVFFNTSGVSAENTSFKKLVLEIEKQNSTLGRPIRADLFGVNLKTKISDLDLSVLNKDFGVVVDYVINNTTDQRWPNRKVQILKFKIYPRKTGTIIIPAISGENISSKEKEIYITKGETSTPSISFQSENLYQQQQFIAHVKILSPHASSRLSINSSSLIENFESSALKFERKINKNGIYELKIGWALTSLKSGLSQLNLPVIEYSVSGVQRKKFYLPSKILQFKALPSYLPPTIPIGKVSIQSSIEKKLWLRSNSISYLNIKLSGNLSNSDKLPPVLRQIKSSSSIKYFPSNSKRKLKSDVNTFFSEVNHSIPFKALSSGFLTIPSIQLQYFDPNNGKITTLTHTISDFFVLSLFWEFILGIVIALTTLYALIYMNKQWKKLHKSKQKREQALQTLKNKNVNSLRKAIKLMSAAENWSQNITVIQWGKYWRNKYQVNYDFDIFISSLSACLYGESEINSTSKLCLELQSIISNQQKLKR